MFFKLIIFMSAKKIQTELRRVADPQKAVELRRFFKTGPGQYGAGDKFLGIVVPAQRLVAKQFLTLPLAEVAKLLQSPYHEDRLTALLLLVEQFKRSTSQQQRAIYQLYLNNTRFINNWDLVDLSAPSIVGAYLVDKDRKILYKLAKSRNLWERRIAILATFYYIKEGDAQDATALAIELLEDDHDLIQKAVGWMLREVGKRVSKMALTDFLDHYGSQMPRTMLRYAIEHLPEVERQKYLALKKEKLCK